MEDQYGIFKTYTLDVTQPEDTSSLEQAMKQRYGSRWKEVMDEVFSGAIHSATKNFGGDGYGSVEFIPTMKQPELNSKDKFTVPQTKYNQKYQNRCDEEILDTMKRFSLSPAEAVIRIERDRKD